MKQPLHDNVKWFEMADLKKRSLSRASWIPLLAYDDSRRNGEPGYIGYKAEYFGAIAILFPSGESKKALAIDWTEINRSFGDKPYIEDGIYKRAGIFRSYRNNLIGEYPVLMQSFETGEQNVWHLTQDIILGLDLYQEEDYWLRPVEDYLQVARIRRSDEGKPIKFEIRLDPLRDFLCAKECGLLIATYQSREIVTDSEPQFKWKNGNANDTGEHYRWQGSIRHIHEGGMLYGGKTAVFHVGRTNIDNEEDVPTYGLPGEDEFESKSWEIAHKGRKLFSVYGEMWRNEWIPPAKTSPRVRGDHIEAQARFIVDASGTQISGRSLEAHRGWLWFKPSVIIDLLKRRKGFLTWYTEYTGGVAPAPCEGVHFGINSIGLINVLAKDIAQMREIYQRIWETHNVLPDGKVSKELLMSQMEAKPADTMAPEKLLLGAINHLQNVSLHFLGQPILKEHADTDMIYKSIHRFHGNSIEGICFLCKELTRLIIERIDVNLLKVIDPIADSKLGSIKRLEHFLNSKGFSGRKITAPLVGAYELRMADAHLPSRELSNSLHLLGIDNIKDHQKMAKEAIRMIAISVGFIGNIIIKSYDEEKKE